VVSAAPILSTGATICTTSAACTPSRSSATGRRSARCTSFCSMTSWPHRPEVFRGVCKLLLGIDPGFEPVFSAEIALVPAVRGYPTGAARGRAMRIRKLPLSGLLQAEPLSGSRRDRGATPLVPAHRAGGTIRSADYRPDKHSWLTDSCETLMHDRKAAHPRRQHPPCPVVATSHRTE